MILDKIIEAKREEIKRRKQLPLPEGRIALRDFKSAITKTGVNLIAEIKYGSPSLGEIKPKERIALRDFKSAITKTGVNLIAEIKYGSPSLGEIKPKRKAGYLAKIYEGGGASAISCVTEKDFFFGDMRFLIEAKVATNLPILHKDFIIDPWQIEESLSYGADGILLIVRILKEELLVEMQREAKRAGLSTIFEVRCEEEIQRAIDAGAEIIGINNRDLQNFKCDLSTTLNLIPHIPKGIVTVSESGIQKREDVIILEKAGVNSILVGEALLSAKNPQSKIKELLGLEKKIDTIWIKRSS